MAARWRELGPGACLGMGPLGVPDGGVGKSENDGDLVGVGVVARRVGGWSSLE